MTLNLAAPAQTEPAEATANAEAPATAATAATANELTAETTAIPLSEPANLRDMGGIPIAEGTLRERFVIRTDDVSIVPETYAAQLVADGLTTIIDLRSKDEVITTGRGVLAHQPVSYHHIPLMGNIAQSIDPKKPAITHESMGEMYIGLVRNAAPQLVTALNVIAYSPGATAFHCTAGRDRTGVLASMLLLILGASDADIVTDYAKTEPNMPGVMQRSQAVLGPTMRRLGFDFKKMQRNALTEGGMALSMEMCLSSLRKAFGDPLTPLRAAGLSDDTITQLRRRATAAPATEAA